MAQTQEVRGVATSIRTENGTTTVKYHNTDVVSFDSNFVVLDSGGWQTVTTKLRMNQASNQFGLGYSVFQKDREWFVDWDGQTLPFKDCMILER